jgi:uncharacterized membrane protein
MKIIAPRRSLLGRMTVATTPKQTPTAASTATTESFSPPDHARNGERHIFSRIFNIACIIAIVLGVVFRLSHLDRAVYWGDEVYTSLRVFGYRTWEVAQAIAQGNLVTAETIRSFQQVVAERGITDTITSLASEDSHMTPLYFVVTRLWVGWFGDSVASIRSVSAVTSVLLLPAVYWFGRELFDRRPVALLATALIAVSPIQLLYAQEARPYAIWTLFTVLTGAALLRAIRVRSGSSWFGFATTLALSLQAHFLGVVTGAGYGIYVIAIHWRDRPLLKRFLLSSTIGYLTILPWLWVFLNREKVIETDLADSLPINPHAAAATVFSGFRQIFFDFNQSMSQSLAILITSSSIAGACFLLLAIASYRLWQETDRRVWLFVLLWMITLPLFLIPILLRGGMPVRYVLISSIAIELPIAYFLATRWLGVGLYDHVIHHRWQKWCYGLALSGLLGLGTLSCGQFIQSSTWWNKVFSACNPTIATIVNQSANPLIVAEGTGGKLFDHALSNVISLAYLVKPETEFAVTLAPKLPHIPTVGQSGQFSDRFLLTPTVQLRSALQAQGKTLTPVRSMQHMYRDTKVCLWRLED